MKYLVKMYKEWVDDTDSSVGAVSIHGNEAAIDWNYRGIPQDGKATSADGVQFNGTYAERGNPAGDRGTFSFTRFPLKSGGSILLGRWISVTGDEREFLLVLDAEKAPKDRS